MPHRVQVLLARLQAALRGESSQAQLQIDTAEGQRPPPQNSIVIVPPYILIPLADQYLLYLTLELNHHS